MNRSLAALAVAMAAPVTWGQSWEFEVNSLILTPSNPSTTVTLSLDSEPAGKYVAGVNFNVHASGGGEWSDPASLVPPSAAPPISQIPGTISGLSVLDISVGQLFTTLAFLPHPGRINLWQATFTATDFSREFTVDLSTETSRFMVYVDDPDPHYPIPELLEVTAIEGQFRLAVIPAPASLALLGLGGSAACRRRRRH